MTVGPLVGFFVGYGAARRPPDGLWITWKGFFSDLLMGPRITGGKHKGLRLAVVRKSGLRPTTERLRGAVFSMLGADAVEGRRVLDLFAGTGALGMEALSRGAASADFVEVDFHLARAIRESLAQAKMAGQGRVLRMKVERALDSLSEGYDLVFVDPPYGLADWDGLMSRIAGSGLTNAEGLLVVEHPSRIALAARYGGIAQERRRRYGDSAVTFYRAEAGNG